MFYFYHGVCRSNYFEYNTFYTSFILWFCWSLIALTIIYTEESYKNFLLESSSLSVHQRHLRLLVTEIYKSTLQINPEVTWSYFTYSNVTFNLRKWPILYLPSTLQHIVVLFPFIFGDPWFEVIFLGILNLANHYLSSKPKLRTLEKLIADV